MPILAMQKRARELGRIRLGHQVTGTTKDGKDYTRPEKLDRFRLTSASQPLLTKVAELYGGEVREWTPKGGTQQWEVITDARRIPILVPPQPLTQWHEFWKAGGLQHRCDGVTNAVTGEPCQPDDPDHLEALTRPTTRLNVVLRDVEGMGVWRLESHGWNAAIELPDAAQFLAQVGGYIEGHLTLEERTSKGENARTGKPETRRFMVPIIEIAVTPAQLLAGEGAIHPPSIGGPVAPAPESGAADGYTPLFELVAGASTREELAAIWEQAVEAKLVGKASADTPRRSEFDQAFRTRAEQIKSDETELDEDGSYPADVVPPDVDAVWQACVSRAGELGMTLWDVEVDLKAAHGVAPAEASSEVLSAYLEDLRQREAA